ncbi:uncharacterized protein LOC108142885 [Drosophila elegans]|uniref:uncharacterized protein LOC108142885 n=1 Tax=Drosophila elegans TaxID=30023 RepID=UPI0007E879EA|nr:uncharacterized protein LOC108142885 [Drosophila elegans]
MYSKKHFWFRLLLTFAVISQTGARIKFTNFKCTSMAKSVADFEYCILKSNSQTEYVSLKLKVFNFPIKSFKVYFGLYQLVNGYSPFLYNITVDGCKFFHSQKSNPVTKYFYDLIKHVSNLNHSCPYNHDFIVHKFSSEMVNGRLPKNLPFPEGIYLFDAHWIAHNEYRAITKLYMYISKS